MLTTVREQVAERKQAFINIMEREAGNLYYQCRDHVLSLTEDSPIVHKLAANYINANQKQWLATLESKIAEIAELSFLSDDTTLEEALINADSYINSAIEEFLNKHLGIPPGAVNIAAQVALGKSIIS